MKINKITIGGFRNINKVKLSLDNIIALVSLNSYGKSNLLEAIEFGIGFIRNNARYKNEAMSLTTAIPLNKATALNDYYVEFEMNTTIKDNEYKVIYGYTFRWRRDDNTGARIVDEWLKIKGSEKNEKYKNYITRTENKGCYRTSKSGRCSNKINVEKSELIINKLEAYDFLYYLDIIKRINNLNMYIERHLDASFSYRPDFFIRTDIEALQMEDNANIPRIIFHLKNKFPDKYELLKNSFIMLFPNIIDIIVKSSNMEVEPDSDKSISIKFDVSEDIPLKVNNQFFYLYVVDSNINQPISFENVSDGAKRVFLILTSIIIADINGYSIVAIEEPENSIHPSLLQAYLRILSQLMEKCRIIVTSHSPYIIQYLNPHDVYIGLPHPDGVADFWRIRESAQKLLIRDASSFGISVGDYIFELLSGTDEDLKSFKHYLEVK